MASSAIDYEALAKKHGAVSSTTGTTPSVTSSVTYPSSDSIDYDALAKQHGAVSSNAPDQGALSAFWEWTGKPLMDLMGGASRDPARAQRAMDTLKAIRTGIVNEPGRILSQLDSSIEAALSGSPRGAAHHLLNAAPFLGEPIRQASEEFHRGQYGAGIGHTTAILTPALKEPLEAATGGALERPLVKSRLNPVQQEAVDFLRSRDVPLSVGTVTGNKAIKGIQALAETSPLGASPAAKAALATETGLKRVGTELMEEAHPAPVTPESAGTAIQGRLKGAISDLAPERDAGYQDAWIGRGEAAHTESVPVRMRQVADPENPGQMIDQPVMQRVNMPVDVRDIKEQARPILDEMSWMPAAERASNAGYRALEKIVEGDDFIPAWAAENGLSGLKSMARLTGQQAKSGMRDVGQGIAASLVGDLQQGIDAAVAKTGDAAFRGLQKGRATHATMEQIAGLAEKLRDEPVQTFNQMHWSHDTGIDFLRRIQQHAPEQMPEIGRALLQTFYDRATAGGGFSKTRGILNEWENLGPETKAILFPDAELRANIGRFLKAAEMVAENPNPSGTARVSQLAAGVSLALQNPLAGAGYFGAGYGASKLLFSPKGVEFLTKGKLPAAIGKMSPAEAQQAFQAAKQAGLKSLPAGIGKMSTAEAEDASRVKTLSDYLLRNRVPNSMLDSFTDKHWKAFAGQAGVEQPSAAEIAQIIDRVRQLRTAAQ